MAKQANIGVNNVAHKIKNIYIGVNNVARKVKAGYIGNGNIARMFFQPGWWLYDGAPSSVCVAAYQFKGVRTEADALRNQVSSAAYPLSNPNTVNGISIWAKETGFTMRGYQGLTNNDLLNRDDIRTILIDWRVNNARAKRHIVRTKDKCFKKGSTDRPGNHTGYDLTLNWRDAHKRFDGGNYPGGLTMILPVSMRLFLEDREKGGHGLEDSVFLASQYLIGGMLNNYYPSDSILTVTAAAFYTAELTLAQFLDIRAKMAAAGVLQ